MKLLIRIFLITIILYTTGCKPVPVSHWFPVTPQEHYEKELYKEKREQTQAGQTWFRESKAVLEDSLFSVVPYQERFFLGDSTPAQAIRLTIPEGRKLIITPLRDENDTTSQLFVELYKIKANGKPQRINYLVDSSYKCNTRSLSDLNV